MAKTSDGDDLNQEAIGAFRILALKMEINLIMLRATAWTNNRPTIDRR